MSILAAFPTYSAAWQGLSSICENILIKIFRKKNSDKKLLLFFLLFSDKKINLFYQKKEKDIDMN